MAFNQPPHRQKPFAARALSMFLVAAMVLGLGLSSERAHAASKTKIYVMTATYGVMAGSLTGLASLAFYRAPGDHLRNVAIGASLGLYTGIILGAYLIYTKPDPNKREEPVAPPATEEEPPSALYILPDLSPEKVALGLSFVY